MSTLRRYKTRSANHTACDLVIPIKYQGDTDEREVFIGDDCWVGCRAIILPGIKIGKGVVIGAGAVVSKDIPDFSVVLGNPERIIRIRGEEKKLDTMQSRFINLSGS